MRSSSSSLFRLLSVARVACVESQGPLRCLYHAVESSSSKQSTSSGSKVMSWSAMGLGFAAAACAGGITLSSASAAATATKDEVITPSGLKVSVGGGAKLQQEAAPPGIPEAAAPAKPEAAAPAKPSSDEPAKATAQETTVVFVLGGPGSGKGTQCARLVSDYDMAHLSTGDLLRAHVKSGTEDGNMVAEMIKQGQIVPSEVTIKLLLKAMADTGKSRFLVDGFPRNMENRGAFERVAGYDCSFVLVFECPEDVLEQRLLGRNEGRTDDNIESIRKRFNVFIESSMPVIEHYEALGKVRRVNTNRPVDEIYSELQQFFNV